MIHRIRSGFTLLEVVVAAVIIAMLAAVTTPYLVDFIDNQRAQTAATQLSALATGIGAFEAVVHGSTTLTYPGRLSELSNIVTSTSLNSCGAGIGSTAVTNWTSFGPFVTFNITPSVGFNTPIGIVSDTMTRSPNSAAAGFLILRMNADSADANRLDKIVDGGDGGTSGTVRFGFNATLGQDTVRYYVPVGSKC